MDRVAPRIGDYAIIGDCRSAALVSNRGSIDWLCWPRFDSPSLFAALIDSRRGGHFWVRPHRNFESCRRYIDDTNVLETTFRTDTGVLRLIDFMPVDSEEGKRSSLWAAHQVLRIVECVGGTVDVEVECAPRPDYGLRQPRIEDRGPLGFYYERLGRAFILRSELALSIHPTRGAVVGTVTLREGERRHLSVVYTEREPSFIPPLGAEAERRLDTTLRWWQDWSERCQYRGPYHAFVRRSALVLKLMAFAPSGAVVAAPTTSLPERLGGHRNWDYRYCWLRDASMTLQTLYALGYTAEARAFMAWLLHATRLTWPELQILYDVYGETHLPERELTHLSGFADSRPVRVGNDASAQLQLDIYGEVVDAAYQFVRHGGKLESSTARLLVGLGKTVCKRWREPDEGIWEIRSGRRHHTYSKGMCWVALDRLLRMHRDGVLRAPASWFRSERQAIRAEVEARGFNEQLRTYVGVFGGRAVDASLLLLARYGYLDSRAPRARSTLAAVRRELGCNGLVYRYLHQDDGLQGGEGAFGICSFWAARELAVCGEVDAAAEAFERVLACANDVGLLAEQIDPRTDALLGNFPQAFTHVGLVDAALALQSAIAEQASAPPAESWS